MTPEEQGNKPIRLYADQRHYVRKHRGELLTLLRPYWKDNPFTEEERRQMYGLTSADFTFVSTMEDTDIVLLPMSWNYYLAQKQVPLAWATVQEARKKNKKVVAHTTGDFGITLPWDDVYVLRPSGYKSRKRPREFALPVFFTDPLPRWSNGIVSSRTSHGKPVVGFCGMATTSNLRGWLESGRTLGRNILSQCRLQPEDKQSLVSSTLLRGRALTMLERDPRIETNFILREKYRAGARTEADRHKTTAEFYATIRESDYTVCLRGGGNFSQRLYETLAMGRIPLFINTDCHLPFDEEVNWRAYCVWNEKDDLKSLPDRVIEDYSHMDSECLATRQKECRRFWEERLSFGGFHKKFAQQLVNHN